MYPPYFDQDLESKKKVVGILAHVWSRSYRTYIYPVTKQQKEKPLSMLTVDQLLTSVWRHVV